MKYKLVAKKELKTICESVDVVDGEIIVEKLYNVLDEINEQSKHHGIKFHSLAAPQIGIKKQVFVLDLPTKGKKSFINPVIVEQSNERVVFLETCINLPGKRITTVRHLRTKIKAENLVNELEFSNDEEIKKDKSYLNDEGLYECVLIQQNVDLLNGILISSPTRRFIPQSSKKIGRNEKVMIKNKETEETHFMKYKKALPLIESGWEVI